MLQEPGIALLTVSTSYADDNAASALVETRLRASGLRVASRAWVHPAEAEIRAQLVMWIASPAIDTIVVCGDAHEQAALTAVQPLVTHSERGFVRCARTSVFVLPESLEGAVAALDRIALPNATAVPARVERIPTDKIAVIGDLPPSAELVSLDLRASGRRGLWMFATAAVAVVAAAAGVLVNASRQQTSTVAVQQPRAAVADESLPAPPPVAAPAPVETPAPAAPMVAPVKKSPPPAPAKHAQPAAAAPVAEPPVAVPAELQPAPAEDDDDSCSQDSCARHHNERECCTPFRNQHEAKLDRAAIARATAGLKAKLGACRDPQVTDGTVRVSVDVAPDGSVRGASVLQAPESGVGQCVADVLRGVTFAATDEGGTFVYRTDLGAD